jgi:predicted alpha/beta-hydrolase family hydrolase
MAGRALSFDAMSSQPRQQALATEGGDISVVLEGPREARALVALAHGAGAGMNGDFLVTVAAGLVQRGLGVCRFNFPYVERGRKSPDREPVLEETWRAVLAHVSDVHEGRLIIGGKSMGGRIASQVVAEGARCDGLLFLGYPLHPPGKPERLRRAHLESVSAPMLFVAGTRDALCRLAPLQETVRALGKRAEVEIIDDGDHSFRVSRSSGRTTAAAWEEVTRKSAAWIARLLE